MHLPIACVHVTAYAVVYVVCVRTQMCIGVMAVWGPNMVARLWGKKLAFTHRAILPAPTSGSKFKQEFIQNTVRI